MITRISFIQSMRLTDVLVVKNPKEDEQLIKKTEHVVKIPQVANCERKNHQNYLDTAAKAAFLILLT